MRLALISLYDLENNAVRILATYLRQAGHDVLEIYFKDWKNNGLPWPTDDELDQLAQGVSRYGAEIIGVSLRASAYIQVCEHVVRHLKRETGLPVLLGGVHPTVCPESSLQRVDYVVQGEGEHPTRELLDRLDAGGPTHDIPGIHTWHEGEPVFNELRDLVEDLPPVMRRDFLHPDKLVIDGGVRYRRDPVVDDSLYLINGSRGCPFACSYCYNSALRRLFKGKGKFYRLRPVSDVMEELGEARGAWRNMRRVRFDDEVFPLDRAWVDEFLERYPREVGLPFECFLEPSVVSEELLERMVPAGLDMVYMGIQANDRVCRTLYDREAHNSAVARAAVLYNRHGVEARYHVMVDDPATTEDDWRSLFDLINGFPRPFQVYLFSMTVMPGTELERKLVDTGLITPDDVEGAAHKTFDQYRVSLEWDRPADAKFWVAMLSLLSKPWMSRGMLDRMSRSAWLREHPEALNRYAGISNAVAMTGRVPSAIQRGELGLRMLRRFWTPGGWITA